ncbi:N-acetylmuramic acid 6-phosphate etherase [Dinghuibacter silviterrae]|uniref:N-acetylmuramic acid 6-phosphate etherase n=1 Tax=Dinghuibacter silviterrae TaxID=1539049 RepID=A0A4R8DER3_9BACT|nr:N-acetylmuramic acid 6-phosphate etherase [Dinghuibacter silviterrae]TDW95887.1 N-acetylmuramic acid 6-phosphate etherase [Dinghuibacter silviterrae]
MQKITEQTPVHRHLEKKSIHEITWLINRENAAVAGAIETALPQLNLLIEAIVRKMEDGGRMFYLGAGSGGRLAVLDAIELPTTYGIPKGKVLPILAGGMDRLIEAREEMEDDVQEGWSQLTCEHVSGKDIVVGISASGTTPFVLGGLEACRKNGITTGCIVSNPGSPIAAAVDWPVEAITGPEFIAGSTRMKCGTAQKMLLDMISTTVMIKLGRVEDNRMVNVQLINDKITDRAVRMLMEMAPLDNYDAAKRLLLQHGSVRSAIDSLK